MSLRPELRQHLCHREGTVTQQHMLMTAFAWALSSLHQHICPREWLRDTAAYAANALPRLPLVHQHLCQGQGRLTEQDMLVTATLRAAEPGLHRYQRNTELITQACRKSKLCSAKICWPCRAHPSSLQNLMCGQRHRHAVRCSCLFPGGHSMCWLCTTCLQHCHGCHSWRALRA